jgi:hypothetical protein
VDNKGVRLYKDVSKLKYQGIITSIRNKFYGGIRITNPKNVYSY